MPEPARLAKDGLPSRKGRAQPSVSPQSGELAGEAKMLGPGNRALRPMSAVAGASAVGTQARVRALLQGRMEGWRQAVALARPTTAKIASGPKQGPEALGRWCQSTSPALSNLRWCGAFKPVPFCCRKRA